MAKTYAEPIGERTKLTVRLSDDLMKAVAHYALTHDMSKNLAFEQILRKGLKTIR